VEVTNHQIDVANCGFHSDDENGQYGKLCLKIYKPIPEQLEEMANTLIVAAATMREGEANE